MFALVELYHILRDAGQAADLRGRLGKWWRVVILRHLLLYHILSDAWRAADLRGRLGEWWWVVTHRHLLDGPPPAKEAADAG